MGAPGQIGEVRRLELRPAPARGLDLVAGLRAAATAVAMTVARPSPEPRTLAVCTMCGRVQPPTGVPVDLSTALAGLRLVRYDVALCVDCFEPPAGSATAS